MLTQNQKLQNGRYTIIRAFGQAKVGRTYEAFDLELRKNVLLKEVIENPERILEDSQIEENRAEFNQQAKTLQKIQHKGLLQIKSNFSEENYHYLVVEMVEGKNLSKLIEINQKPFSFVAFTKWADHILESISLLHSQSPPIIHRDIQPQNIHLSNNGEIKVSTLNIIQHSNLQKYLISKEDLFESKNLAFSPLEKVWDDLDSASQNVILNNFDEQSQSILENPADARSDIYSLGATFYYLLTAKLPLDSLTRLIEVLDGNEDPLPAPHTVNSDVPKEFSDVIMKSLEIKRENRFNSVVIMRQIMRTALSRLQKPENEAVKKNVNKKPQTIPLPAEPARPLESDQKQQFELIKKQLREAEERRLAAEQRAFEAERLLQKQEEIKTNKVETPINTLPVLTTNADISEIKAQVEVETEAKIETELGSTSTVPISGINEDLNDEINKESTDYFADLYEEPQQTEGKSYIKYVVGALILFLLGGFAWGFWSFYKNNANQTEQVISSEEKVPPVNNQDITPIPTLEPSDESIDDENIAADTDSESASETDEEGNSVETNDLLENNDITNPTPNASTQRRPRPKPVNKKPVQKKPAAKRPKPSKAKKPRQKKKSAEQPKKPVTLDDLLKDG